MDIFIRIVRPIIIILVALAANAVYIQSQWVYHNHPEGWYAAICSLLEGAWQITAIAIIILIGFVVLEYFYQKNKESQTIKIVEMLEAIEKKL